MKRFCRLLFVGFFFVFTLSSPSAFSADSPKEWTFLTYLNGNNDLDADGTTNILQMEQVGSTDQINVVVQWASLERRTTQRIYVKKNTTGSDSSVSPVIEEFQNPVDMGDWKSLVDFVRWGVKNYPAKHYFINVWNHGNGWHLQGLEPKDISFDDISGHFITTKELGVAMREAAAIIGHKVDLFAADACLMAMIEVAEEMAPYVQIFAASEEVEPAAGWPYQSILKRWAAVPGVGPDEVAKIITTEYVQSYSGGSNGTKKVTFSAIDLNRLEPLVSSIQALRENLEQLPLSQRKLVLSAASLGQHFTYPDYVDLNDFLQILGKRIGTSMAPAVFQSVKDAFKGALVINKASPAYSKASGISIWVPTSKHNLEEYSDRYEELQFASKSGWGQFLKNLY